MFTPPLTSLPALLTVGSKVWTISTGVAGTIVLGTGGFFLARSVARNVSAGVEKISRDFVERDMRQSAKDAGIRRAHQLRRQQILDEAVKAEIARRILDGELFTSAAHQAQPNATPAPQTAAAVTP